MNFGFLQCSRVVRNLLINGLLSLLFIQAVDAGQDKSSLSPSKISLPTGPGSIDGLGESFEAQLNSGTFSYSIPIKLPAVRGNATIDLIISYNSGNGNGALGMGWRLDLPRLQRQTDKGLPNFTSSDTIIDSTGEELVKLADGTYRCENENKSVLFEWNPDDSWSARLPNGSVLTLGGSSNSRLAGEQGTFLWMISSIVDTNGNKSSFTYLTQDGQIYIDTITIGQHQTLTSETYSATFSYQDGRPDPLLDYRPGFSCQTSLRLSSITIRHEDRRLAYYRINYKPHSPVSLLESITKYGDQRSSIGDEAKVNKDFLPPHTFTYNEQSIGKNWQLYTVDKAPNYSVNKNEMEFADINADGLPDLLIFDEGSYYSALNHGQNHKWGTPQKITNSPNIPLNKTSTQLLDLRGDGRCNLLVEDSTGFYFKRFETPTQLSKAVDFERHGFPLSDTNIRFVDLNNDKAMDMLATDSNGFYYLLNGQSSGKTNTVEKGNSDTYGIAFTSGWTIADINGDRLADLVLPGASDEGGCVFHYSLGFGKFSERHVISNGPTSDDLIEGANKLHAVDINHDGWTDFIYVTSGQVVIWLNQGGQTFADPIRIADPKIPDVDATQTGIRFVDINGNGSTDIVWNRTDQSANDRLQYLELSPGTKPYLLTSAVNELGGSISIEYKPSTDFMTEAEGTAEAWTSFSPISLPLVSALTEHDGRGNAYRSEISYRNPYYDGVEKEFRGFETATRRDLGDNTQGAPSLQTNFQFHTGSQHEALKGKLKQLETIDETSGEVFSRVDHHWTVRQLALEIDPSEQRSISLAYQDQETTSLLERGPDSKAVTLHQEFQVNDYGSITQSSNYGRIEGDDLSAWDDERFTHTLYSGDFESGKKIWLLDRPIQTVIQDEEGKVISQLRNYYDDPTFSGGNLGQVTKGNLTLEQGWYDIPNDKNIKAVRNVYNNYGNLTRTYDPEADLENLELGHYVDFVYDEKVHSFIVTETLHSGNTLCPNLTTTATYDYGLGLILSLTDSNGNLSQASNDTFGRVTAIIKPGDSIEKPTITFSYLLSQIHSSGILNWIETNQREMVDGETIDSRLYFDGLGRKLQSRSESEHVGKAVVSEATLYNQRKLPWKVWQPYFSDSGLDFSEIPESNSYSETQYDATGRNVKNYQPEDPKTKERAFSLMEYEPLAILLHDEEQSSPTSVHYGAAVRQIFDGLTNSEGKPRLRKVEEIVKISDVGEPTTTSATWTTTYDYDLLDNVIKIVDSQNNTKTLSFDALSRMTGIDDPDAGLLSYTYYDNGNLKSSTDANGHVIEFQYDGANRVISEDYHITSKSPDVLYFYDVPTSSLDLGDGTLGMAENCKGKLAYVYDLSGEEHRSYDSRGRVEWEVKRLSAHNYSPLTSWRTQYNYDSADRITRVIYPDGDYVDTRFNERSLPKELTGGPSGYIVSDITYRAAGQQDTITYGNGVSTVHDYDHRLRLSSLQTHRTGNDVPDYISNTYEFDQASNITEIKDERDLTDFPNASDRQNSQSFTYDDLYRLTKASWPKALNGKEGNIDYRYDRIGNMVSQLSNLPHVEDGKSVANLGAMTVGGDLSAWGRSSRGSSSAGPHALTAVNLFDTKTLGRSYSYDPKGNMTNIDGLACQYDAKDRLISVENDKMRAEYVYDFTDRRVGKKVYSKSEPATTEPQSTQYINRYFEVREYKTPVKYVWLGNQRIARVTGTLAKDVLPLQWLNLHKGWNLISLSSNADTCSELLANTSLSAICFWDSQNHIWINLESASNPPNILIAWVRSNIDQVLPIRGPPANQVGNSDDTQDFYPVLSPEVLTAGLPTSSEWWNWDPSNQRWNVTLGSVSVDKTSLYNNTRLSINDVLYYPRYPGETMPSSDCSLSVRYYHADHLGSTTVVTDEEGELVEESNTYPFGHPRSRFQPRQIGEPYGFTQKELDEETGLHYFEARFLVSTVGRFNRADPLYVVSPTKRQGIPQSLNMYSYCGNGPSICIDDTGLEWNLLRSTIATIPPVSIAVNTVSYVHQVQKDTMQMYNDCKASGSGDFEAAAYSASFGIGRITGGLGVVEFFNGAHIVNAGNGLQLVGYDNLWEWGSNGALSIFQTSTHATGLYFSGRSIFAAKNELADLSNLAKPLGRGSTGRTAAANLQEQMAMKQAMSNPASGAPVPLSKGMTDPRWPASDGWVKMRQNVNGVEVHYIRNTRTGVVDDFKFKD